MRVSRYLIRTLKETPSDADTLSAKLMLRAGMIRKVASGIYDWMPFGFKSLKKVEQIIREEMDKAGALEVWLPTVQPKNLWEETGRWSVYGKELLRFKDRKNGDFCYAPTAEEIITDLARREIRSYKELPITLYQFGSKFRDEIRPRFGVMRAREFYMKDAYSFHGSDEDLDKTYQVMVKTYKAIFDRLGLNYRPVEADSGAIGGSSSHEFMVLADTGEETIAACSNCGYAANIERADTLPGPSVNGSEAQKDPQDVETPNKSKVDDVASFLNVPKQKILKTVFVFADQEPVVAVLRGDTELNEPKLQRLLSAKLIRPAKDEEYRAAAGCEPGFAGPQHVKVKLVVDHLVPSVVNGVSGAGKKDAHCLNINYGRDFKSEIVGDIHNIREKDPCPRCQTPVSFSKGIEVGHVFKLGTKYSAPLKAEFLDEGGASKPLIMGCYGIGVSRIVAAAIEQNSDENGIQWPIPLAPFEVILTPANMAHDGSKEAAEKIYEELKKFQIDVILDDRDVRAGIKFKDADLLGIPYRVTIGEKSLAKGIVEFRSRKDGNVEEIPVAKAAEVVSERIKSLRT